MIGALRAIEARDLEDVSEFLIRVRASDADASFAAPRMLEWKYLRPRSEWADSRGFVLEKDGRIVAFGGVIPAELCLSGGGVVKTGTIIDWAADRSVPGVGVIVLTKVLNKTGTMFILGGTQAARDVLPKIGFRSVDGVPAFARWVRPWKEFRTRPKTSRSALRLLHGLSHWRSRRVVKDWDSVPVKEFSPSLEPLLNRRWNSETFCRRTVENLNYMLQCPAVEMQGFLLRRNKTVVGYFVVAKTGWEARLLDICVGSDQPEDWQSGVSTAVHAVGSDPRVCRIFAWAVAPKLQDCLVQNGFWRQEEKPIVVRDPKNLLAGVFPLNLQMFDGESAYLTT